MPDIDNLNIKISASSSGASRSISTLIGKLRDLNSALENYDIESKYIKSIGNLADGFERIAESVNKIDVDKIGSLAKNLSGITSQLNRMDKISGKLGFGEISKSANVMGESVKRVADDLAKTWGITNKEAIADLETKFDDYINTAVSGSDKVNESFKKLADTIRDNARIADDSKAVYADLLKYVEKTNSAFLSGKGSSITLGFDPSEFTDDYTSMRATAGAAFTSQVGAGNGDFENYINELNSALGNIIPVGNTAAETFSNFVRILKDARNNTVSFSEAVQNGFVGPDSVDEDIVEFSNDIYKLERAARQAGEQVTQSSYSFQNIAESLNSLGSINIPDATNLATFVSALQGLGTAKIEKAAANLPALGEGLKKLFVTLKDAPTVNSSVIQMTDSLANLASQGGRVGTASNTLTGGLDRSSKSMDRAKKSSLGLAVAFGKLYAKLFIIVRGAKKLWSSIENSMSYIETLNYFNAAFDQITEKADLSAFEELGYKSAEEYANSFSDRAKELTAKMTGFNINDNGTLTATGAASLGLNPDKLMNYQAMFGQMASSMGVASDNAVILSNVLTEIGADLASVKNLEFEEVWQDMASGLTGMSRTLDKYGVNIRNVNLQQKLTDLGIQANIANLNQQDKALLRTIVLLDSTRYAWADLADTIDQPANQLRLLQANFQNLSRTIGNLFLPIVQKVLPYINGLVIAVQRLAQWLANLLGIDLSGVSSVIGGTDISGFSDSLDEATDAMGAASKAADKLKKGIRGFDELNVITTKDDTDSGSGAGAGVGGLLDDAFLDAVSEYQKAWDEAFANLQNKAEQIADRISKVFEPVKKLFEDIKIGDWFAVGQDVSNIVSGIFNFFADAIASVDWYKIGHNIGEFLSGIDWTAILSSIGRLIWEAIKASIELWMGSFDAAPIETGIITAIALLKWTGLGKIIIDGIKKAILSKLSGLAEIFTKGGFLTNIGLVIENLFSGLTLHESMTAVFGTLGTTIAGILTTVGGLIIAFTNFFSMLREGFSWVKEAFMVLGIAIAAVGAIILGVPAGIAAAVAAVVAVIATLVVVIKDHWEEISGFFSKLWDDIVAIWGKVSDWFGEHVVEPVVGFFDGLKTRVQQIFEGLWIIIKAVWIVVSTWFNENVIIPVVNFFAPIVERLSGFFSAAWEKIKEIWAIVSGWFSENIIDPLSEKFEYACEKIGEFFSGLWSGIKKGVASAMNAVIGAIEGALNWIIDGINSKIEGFNKIVSWASKITGDSWGGVELIGNVSLGRINVDGYASGGFIENPHSYSLFMAGENGIPEILGTVGGQPAVAGGQEITGISDTIRYESERDRELLRQLLPMVQQLCEKEYGITKDEIGQAARDYSREYFDKNGKSAFAY